MRDRLAVWVGVLMLAAATLACNAFAGRQGSTLPPPPQATATLPGGGSELEGGPGIAPTVTLPGSTPVPENLPAVRILVDLNIRSGPGVEFRRVGFLLRGDSVPVLDRDEVAGWWQIVCPATVDSSECWVSGGSQYTRLEEPPAPTP